VAGKGARYRIVAGCASSAEGAADIISVRAVLAHAKDDAARKFYEHFNFDPSPVEPLHMFLLVKEIARLLET
jgi:hypothetical protein